MKRSLPWVLCAALVACFGCGGSDDEGGGGAGGSQDDAGVDAPDEASSEAGQPDATTDAPAETGNDAQPEAGQDAMPDATADVAPDVAPDAPEDAPPDVVPDVQPDVAPDVGAETGPDAQPDASTRPPGQCANNADCSGPAATCSMAAPGGICMGCGQDSDCGNPLEFECYSGACRRYCTDDEDCPSGLECSANLYCKLISCSSGCPAPYVCGGNFCNRPTCAATTPQCPDGMSCGQGDYCVEDGL